MRLPFLQLDGDFIAHRARDVAALLGCSRAQAVGHLSLLWAWALSRGSEDAPPSGLVAGPRAVVLIEAAAEWAGTPGEFFEALCDPDVGLLEKTAHGVRVRGMDRYAKAWDKQRKDRARKAGIRATSSGIPADGAGKTQTQTQTQKEPSASQGPAGAGPEPFELEAQKPPAKKRASPKAPDSRHAPLKDELVALGFPFDGAKDAAQLTALLALADQQPATAGEAAPAEVLRRAKLGWRQFPAYHSARTLAALRSKWGDLAEPSSGGRGPAPPSNFERPREGTLLPPEMRNPPTPEDGW